MPGYYLKLACRNLWRNRLYSGLCMLGLALAFAIVTLIYAHVRDELSFNSWLPEHERVDQIALASTANGLVTTLPPEVGLWMAQDIAEAEAVTSIVQSGGTISIDNNAINVP